MEMFTIEKPTEEGYKLCQSYCKNFDRKIRWTDDAAKYASLVDKGAHDDIDITFPENEEPRWNKLLLCERYILKYPENKSAGRRRSQKRPTARRRRSSKARNARKSRKSRNTRRR